MDTIKLIVSSKSALEFKYKKNFSKIESLLAKLQAADRKKGLTTKIVFIDDAKSARAAGIAPVKNLSPQNCKKAIDELYNKHLPAYIVILGAQDVIPFQDIKNPAEDEDTWVPSDLPYACDAPFSQSIDGFTGPTRVVGRIPDLPGQQTGMSFLKTLIESGMTHTPKNPDDYYDYFSISAHVWEKSTQMSLQSMFNNSSKLILSPLKSEKTPTKFKPAQLKALMHFYNCHGARFLPTYWGQQNKENYPEALNSTELANHVAPGTVVAAECCYGAQLYELEQDQSGKMPKEYSIANTYFANGALGLVGSSTIAYGPADSNANADYITQFFMKSILKGASLGRAFLEARHQFLSESGPDLDPYELKTLAQFYLLGDPSVQPVICDDIETMHSMNNNTTRNSRANLIKKGMGLQQMMVPSSRQKNIPKSSDEKKLKEILKTADFEDAEKEFVYKTAAKMNGATGMKKKLLHNNPRFRTYIKDNSVDDIRYYKVLVVKEDKEQVLGWRVYDSK